MHTKVSMIESAYRKLALLALLLGALLTPAPSFAQMTSGDLTGVVSDASGAAVPNANVEAVNVATGVKTTSVSNASGEYHLANLAIGSYNLTATATGFAPTELKGVAVDLNKQSTANIALQVGTTASTVEVTEAASTIDTSTAQISNVYEARLAQDLPTASIGSGVINLSLLAGGVATSGGVGAGSGPSVGGQRPRNNNFTVEGIDNNNKSVTGPNLFIPNDAVQEFTLLQNQYTAEYGHSSGGQFNTNVKSGTNGFHGSIYEYMQNRNFNAIDQIFQNQGFTSNPRFDQNRLGATFGGPIIKNKLFFFANFEYNPLGQASTTGSVIAPTSAGLDALAGQLGSGVNQTNLGILKQYLPNVAATGTEYFQAGNGASGNTTAATGCPDPTLKCYSVPTGGLSIAGPNFTNSYYGVLSVDYNMSEKDQLRGRMVYNGSSSIDPNAQLPAFYTTIPTTYYLGTLTEYHNFSPNVINEFRLGYNRYNNTIPAGNFKFPGLDSFPNLTIDDLGIQLGPDGNAPQFTIQNLYQFTDNISWTYNKHQLKFGFDGRKYISPQTFTQRARGDYEYSNLANYLLDLTPDDLAQRTTGAYIYYGDQVQAYAYANDTYKATKNFTLNLGVRYEFTSIPYGERLQDVNAIANVPGVLTFQRPQPQYLNFAPRIGIAYTPGNSGNTSIRAGFGMNYDVLYDNLGILSAPPQFQQTVDVTAATDANNQLLPNFLSTGGISPSAAPGVHDATYWRNNTSGYIPDQKLPYSIQWNFGIQHVFARNYTFEARYVGTRGIHLSVQDRINKTTDVTPTNSLPVYLSPPSQAQLDALPITLTTLKAVPNTDPKYTSVGFISPVVAFLPIGSSTYHGLSLQLDRRFSEGFTFRGAYTWSHNIDNSTADVFSTLLSPRRPENFQNLAIEKASSALDHRQRFTLAVVYDLPFFRNGNFFVKNLIGNWEVAPIYTYQTPEYYTVQSQADANLNGDSFTDRALINSKGVGDTSTDVTTLKNSAGATVGYLANDPTAKYIRARAGVYANGGRNTLAGKPIDNLDLTAIKRFSITERLKLEFSAQLLNALNHAQFIAGSLNDVRSIGYTSGPVRNFLTPGNAIFNNPSAVFSSNPRTIQLTGKFFF